MSDTPVPVELLAGIDLWHTPAVGSVPPIRMSDGPAGVRGTSFTGPASASFPCGTALAATFDPDLIHQVGQALGREARSKSAQVLLAPTVNLHRTPIGGRNFECMSEDPVHTAAIATAYVEGVQSRGVACCIKHLVGNDTEYNRFAVSSEIDERVLREVYLVPFEAAVAAGVRSIMTAYNRLNGTFCSEHEWLLSEVVRRDWGFDGVLISDWFGTHSTVEAVLAGLDIEMPGPPQHRGPKLQAALEAADDPARLTAAIEASATRIASLAEWTAAADSDGSETTDDDPSTRAIIRRAAAAGTVMLSNDGVLPLHPRQRVALIGPYARTGRVQGGGSAQVRPHQPVAIEQALAERGLAVESALGCRIEKHLPVIKGAFTLEISDTHGRRVTTELRRAELIRQLGNDEIDGLDALEGPTTAQMSGRLVVDRSGTWWIGVRAVGEVIVRIDGNETVRLDGTDIGGSFFGFGSSEVIASVELDADVEHVLEVDYPAGPETGMRGVIIGAAPADDDDLLPEAVDLAGRCDVSVVVVGTNNEWETEGEDRAGIELPGAQDRLIEAVAAASQRTVVVINAGSPVAMPWLDAVDAVLVIWFPGSQLGAALTDVLLGDVEPGGRLPVTFPRTLADTPAAATYPGDGTTMEYAEGLLIGYRWYLERGIEPLFWFGEGRGYTEFEWANDEVEVIGHPNTGVEVIVPVTNIGRRAGHEVVQVYVRYVGDHSEVPSITRFVGSARVHAVPGEGIRATVQVPQQRWMSWLEGRWVLPVGPHEVLVGRHAGALTTVATVTG